MVHERRGDDDPNAQAPTEYGADNLESRGAILVAEAAAVDDIWCSPCRTKSGELGMGVDMASAATKTREAKASSLLSDITTVLIS